MMMRTAFMFVVALAVTILIGTPVMAGQTLIEKDFVGTVENAPNVGAGDSQAVTPAAARFAGSKNAIAEGSHPGDGGPDYRQSANTEKFIANPAIPVTGLKSANNNQVFTNRPYCVDPTGAGHDQAGRMEIYSWAIELERPVVSDIQVAICLDVLKCQEEDDRGPHATQSMNDFVDGLGWEAPLYISIAHKGGPMKPAPQHNDPDLIVPGLDVTSYRGGATIDLPKEYSINSDPFGVKNTVLQESIALIGADCLIKWIPNDNGHFAQHDTITVSVVVPSSVRVRVRASQDSVALAYIGVPLPGE
jgi:hypothetical protein